MLTRLAAFLPALLWMAFIFTMSSQEKLPGTFGVSMQLMAVVGHLLMYGLLAALLLIAIHPGHPPSRASIFAAVVCTMLYGISDEFHQSFVPGRDASLFDVVVNTIGAVIGVTLWVRARSLLATVRAR